MPKYTVDVKAFINITVEAANEDDARQVADAFAENAGSFSEHFCDGYNEGLPQDALGRIVPGQYDFSVDGESDVDLEDDEADFLNDFNNPGSLHHY